MLDENRIPTPTFGWVIAQARLYLDGGMTAHDLHLLFSDVSKYFAEARGPGSDEELKDACAYIWMRSQRVLRMVIPEEDLRLIILELMPDLERLAAKEPSSDEMG